MDAAALHRRVNGVEAGAIEGQRLFGDDVELTRGTARMASVRRPLWLQTATMSSGSAASSCASVS